MLIRLFSAPLMLLIVCSFIASSVIGNEVGVAIQNSIPINNWSPTSSFVVTAINEAAVLQTIKR